jgi:hypothetical protein
MNRRATLLICYSPKIESVVGIADTIKFKREPPLLSLNDSSIKEGASIILKNLNFYGGRHIPLPQGEKILNLLLGK